MSQAFAQWRQQVLATAQRIDDIDYFRLLGCQEGDQAGVLRKAFRSLAAGYHPDRYRGLGDEELLTALTTIYSRVTEAYGVLRDPATNRSYRAGLAAGHKRYDPSTAKEAMEALKAKKAPGRSPKGRQHYRNAVDAQRSGDLFTAKQEIKLALLFDPGEPAFVELAKALQS